jgi:hypothetical protein
MKEILKTNINWIDKERKVKGITFKFQIMYNKEVVVFDKNDLIKLIKVLEEEGVFRE